MFNVLLASFQVGNAVSANRLLHFLARFPFLRKSVDSLYGEYELKNILMGIVTVYKVIKKILFRIIWILFLVGSALMIYFIKYDMDFDMNILFNQGGITELASYLIHIWFVLSFIGAAFNSTLIDSSFHDETMIFSMRVNPTKYAKANILFDRVTDLLLYLPLFLLLFFTLKVSILGIFNIIVTFTAFRLLGECINMLLYKLFKITFRNYALVYILGTIAVAYTYVYPFFYGVPQWYNILISPVMLLVSVAIGALAIWYITKYPLYDTLLKETILQYKKQMNLAKKNSAKFVNLESTKKWAKDVQADNIDSSKFENRRGFAYLNAIFFDRHSKYFYKKVRLRVVTTLLFGIAACLGILLMRHILHLDPAIALEAIDNDMAKSPTDFVSIFFFIIYLISMGRVVTASVFSNCDIEMLNYPYYKTPRNILRSFNTRFLYIIRGNLLISTALTVVTIAVCGVMAGYVDFVYAGVLLVTLTAISIFFAFNDLFIYYIIQPYDSAANVKSVAYNIINVVIYIIAYANLNLPVDFFIYSAIVTGATVVYVAIGSLLLQKVAPKTFKLR